MNEVICHGIPDSRPLEDGDIVNLDITVFLHGMHGDCSATFLGGEVDPDGRRLVQVARSACEGHLGGVARLADLGHRPRDRGKHASRHGYGVVRLYCGHGILGETFHTSSRSRTITTRPR